MSSSFALEFKADRVWCSVNVQSTQSPQKTLVGAANDSTFSESILRSSDVIDTLKSPTPLSIYKARTFTFYSGDYPVVLQAETQKTQLGFYIRSEIKEKDSKKNYTVYSTLQKKGSSVVLTSTELTEDAFQSAINQGLKLSFLLPKEAAFNIGEMNFDKVELFCAAADAEKEIPQF